MDNLNPAPVAPDPRLQGQRGAAVRDTLQRTPQVKKVIDPRREVLDHKMARDRGATHRDAPKDPVKPIKKVERVDSLRPHCKARPKDNRPRGGGGGGKPKTFVTWCK